MFVRKKLRREDFLFENGWFETVSRAPGELQMQQFQISDCEECNIFLFDTAACVYIDQCKYCTVFIAACESSVFVRDCQATTVICTTQQFRVRDCTDSLFSLSCDSQPIIESSKGITFTNFPPFNYQSLEAQMLAAKIHPWNNNWFDIYDFTPHKFNANNYTLAALPPNIWNNIKKKLNQKMKEIGLKEIHPLIPKITGKGEYQIDQLAVLVAYPLPPTISSEDMPLIQSKVHNLCKEELKALSVNIEFQSPRIKILFIKVQRKLLSKWRKYLKNIVEEVTNTSTLELYETTVFAPFKDEH